MEGQQLPMLQVSHIHNSDVVQRKGQSVKQLGINVAARVAKMRRDKTQH